MRNDFTCLKNYEYSMFICIYAGNYINDCFLQDLTMAEALVKDMIQKNSVMVFSKTYCPFCTMAKEALRDAGLKEVNMHTRNNIYNHAV